MPRPRAPWWMFVVAASFLAFVTLIVYQFFWGPFGPTGFQSEFRGGEMVVLAVDPNSLAERAGLKPGDRVLSVDGNVIRNVHDWQAMRANTEVGRPERWEIVREGQRLERTLTYPSEVAGGLASPDKLLDLTYLGVVLTSIVLSLVIAFSRPYDPVARIGAWCIGTASIAFGVPWGWAATWRHLPALIGLLLWIPQISRFVADAILFTFFTIFPRKLFRARWPWFLVWAPVILQLPWRVSAAYSVTYHPEHAVGAPEWIFRTGFVRTVIYLVGGLVALVANYRRLEDVNQRRRVRVLVAGVAVSLLAALGYILIESWGHATSLMGAFQAALFVLFLAFPLSFAYAILRHRLFDIRVMIRQGLQYALARGVLTSLVPLLAALLLLDLIVHSDQPLVVILTARGWVYAALGGLALLAHVRRGQWLEALDRRFFRERYDAQHLLREVVEEVREARGFEQVAPHAVAQIEAALHPEFVALLVRERREANYRTLAAAPAGKAPPPLPSGSKLVALVRLLGKPLEVPHTESGWLQQQLPHQETDFLRQARIDLLVPVAAAPEGREALLALGIKRSEEPYTREDQDLLIAITSSLALLLEKPAVAPAQVLTTFEECPQCGACYDPGAGRCAEEGASLIPVHLPRMLAGRYRLERRRGRGGMGAVYEATDTALERRVAVKVIRDDLVGSAEAAERFRREARTAASFAHPNVATIYDFGVAAGTRAFLVMELLAGATLREELLRKKRLAAPRTLEIMRGVCAAVDAAHRRQLIHRDLKPENIFLVRDETSETAKVLDFGIAKFLPTATGATADTGSGLLVGTLHYLAPEQLQGLGVEPGWDLWALAVVAYEMLTGAQPFAGATPAEWESAVLAGRFTPLAKHLAEAPARWQEFFARAFALEKDKRPTSALTFFSELERSLA